MCPSSKDSLTTNDTFQLSWDLTRNERTPKPIHHGKFTLVNHSNDVLKGGWTLYFNSLSLGDKASTETGFKLERKSGDFFSLKSDSSKDIKAGSSLIIEYQSKRYIEKNSDSPITPYLVLADQKTIIPLNDTFKKQLISLEDKAISYGNKASLIPTPEKIFKENAQLTNIADNNLLPIIPSPYEFIQDDSFFKWPEILKIYSDSFDAEVALFIDQIKDLGLELERTDTKEDANLVIEQSNNIDHTEGYSLQIRAEKIVLHSSQPNGAYYGLQSLSSLIHHMMHFSSEKHLKTITIHDKPRFKHRGLFLDIARNFQQKEDIKQLINLMSFFKLNVLQLHLSNDEAWRIEIPDLPELTTIGSHRGHSEDEKDKLYPYYGSGPEVDINDYANGYLSRNDFIEIIQYAHQRHVSIIPEIVAPGHMKAAIIAMNYRYRTLMKEGKKEAALEYLLEHPEDQSKYKSVQNYTHNTADVCLTSTYTFYAKVLDEIIQMYEEAKVPITIFHTGGDEVPKGVWEESPACIDLAEPDDPITFRHILHHHFYKKIKQLFDERGLRMAGWEEVGQSLVINDRGTYTHIPDTTNPGFSSPDDGGFRLHAWNSVVGWGGTDMAYKLANAGYEVVLSNSSNLYFDLAYNRHPDEVGLHWSGYVDTRKAWQMTPYNHFISNETDIYGNAIDAEELASQHVALNKKGKQNIIGLQGQLWSETIKGPNMMFRALLPKMLGLVERSWSPQPSWATEQNPIKRDIEMKVSWNLFANHIGKVVFPFLADTFSPKSVRIPEAGVLIENDLIHMNVSYPGTEIRYTDDGTEPSLNSQLYTSPIPIPNTTEIRVKVFAAKHFTSRTHKIKLKSKQ